MGFIAKLKLLFKASKPLGQFVNQVKGAKAKYKTIPFWITTVGSLLSVVGAVQGFIPPTAAVIINTVLASAYNILRGADKINQVGIKPPLQTTEFWVGLGNELSNGIVQMQTAGVDHKLLVSAQMFIAAAMAAAQSLGAHQPAETTPVVPK